MAKAYVLYGGHHHLYFDGIVALPIAGALRDLTGLL